MPTWTQEHIQPPWSKPHTITLSATEVYDRAAGNGGSNKIQRHAPLSLANGHGRKAGTSGVHPGQDDPSAVEKAKNNGAAVSGPPTSNGIPLNEDWERALEDDNRVCTIRDVKNAVTNFKVVNPKHHAFARFVLPVACAVFADQHWPGKKDDKEEQHKKRQSKLDDDQGKIEMSPEQKDFYHQLVEEMETMRNFKNNEGKPEGDLKLSDSDAMQQLESGLSVEDQMTPDSWVPRSPKLFRLTGAHPLNAEPNLSEMFEAGMITPTKLHYVRSHGAVPQLSWETHKLSIFSDPPGLVQPRELTMDEIAGGENFKVFEIPVTIACDGNRRKEMNMVKQTAGVNFSAAGVSTCIWRGVLVRDILLASGLQDQPDAERWYVNFEGTDKCSEGAYATSIPLMHAMQANNDVMLAFGQNGRVLHPDHGYPLRAMIPGYVGGRQVKWVHKIWISTKPNTSYYHIWDNRVIPGLIKSNDDPLAAVFRQHEVTACMEQTLQSIICKPAHNEVVTLPTGEDARRQTYNIEGFAYNGCGTAINLVELTLDGGKTWKYCFKKYLPKPLRWGEKHWAWIFWSCNVRLNELANTTEFAVRTCDAKMQMQPEHMAWNMTGMMNNAWYRVRHIITQDPKTQEAAIQFKHPVAPGSDESGWMKPNPEDIQQDTEISSGERVLSLEEISKHNQKNDAWIIIENKVYDVTPVLSWHPGGAAAILAYAGKATVDATIKYKGIHDNYANSKRNECYIGVLSDEAIKEMEKDAKRATETLAKIKEERKGAVLQPDFYARATLVKKHNVSSDTRMYVFELPKRPNGKHGLLQLPIGKHLIVAVHFGDQAAMRPYTPIAPVLQNEEDGTFTLCVKTYFPTDGGLYPPGGLVSNYLDYMKEGEEIDIRGPEGEIEYKGRGHFVIEGKEHQFDKVNLVAGGSGLTPHWQIIHAIVTDEEDETKVSLIDCNKAYVDILMRDELQKCANKYTDKFKLWHAVSKAPKDASWKYGESHLNQALMEKHLYPPGEGVVTLLCGPPGLIEHGAIPALEKMGFKLGENVFGF